MVPPHVHQQAQALEAPPRPFVLAGEIVAVELQSFGEILIPLQDLIIQKPDLVLLGVPSCFIGEIVIPHLGRNLVVFCNVSEIWMTLVLRPTGQMDLHHLWKRGRGETYWFRQSRIDVCVLQSKWHARSKTPATIESIHGPEDPDCLLILGLVGKRLEQGFLAVQAHLDAHASRNADEAPRLGFFVLLEIVLGLTLNQYRLTRQNVALTVITVS